MNMLKMNSTEQLNVQNEKEKDETRKKNETGRSGSSQRNWIRKLGNYSQTKYQLPSNPLGTNAMRPLDMNSPCNTYKHPTPTKTSDSPKTPPEMPDLESIIREFETGFLSPTKSQDISIEQFKQKNFVKKIVTAFEVKYKRYNDLKAAQESKQEDASPLIETPKRKFKVFGSNFKTSPEEPQHRTSKFDDSNRRQNVEKSEERSGLRRSGIFGSPFNVSCEELKVPDSDKSPPDEIKNENTISKDRSESSKNRKKFAIFSSPSNSCGDSSASSEIYRDPVHVDCQNSKDRSSNSSDNFKFDKDKIRASNFLFSPSKVSSLDETKSMDSVDFDLTLPDPEETILLEGNALQKTSTMINDRQNYDDIDDCFVREISSVDKTPKVVGAYLKEPIEVEDTSIDWIPITGKKLPRKRSLKKLLNALTGKRTLEKKCKLFSSERNLYQDSRELQDSGYDDKSVSSSSLNSLISITEVLLHQENSYIERERRGTLTTFRPKNLEEEEEDEVFSDTYACSSKRNRKKLLLTEMPREDVKVDLGPAYPSSTKFITMSLDRKMISKKTHPPSPVRPVITRLPKHPCLSKIPKHPFVSLTKMDELQETCDVQESRDSEESSVIIKNDLYEVEFRKSCMDVYSSVSCRSSSSTESNYDVPRRFLSKSENELRLDSEGKRTEPIYDVPKSTVLDRPRSSVYEDIVASRRSVQSFESAPPSIYAVPRTLEVRCATVETRNGNMYLDNKVPSLNDLTIDEMRTAV
nr:PREDICTED: uncharacterized protein LOC100880958 isoform X2 [Megachile rotundata]XP_012152345.1 PREDICTED: uncharacterized protein LOC100880958 isoform X2 [Megachile rotundata]